MSELSEEEIARDLFDEMEGPVANQDFGRQQRQWELCQRLAKTALAILQPALERARGELTDEQDLLLMCAVENLRSADRNDRTVEAAWRMAEKMEAWRKAAAIRKG